MKLKKFNYKRVNSTNDIAIKIIKNSNYKFGIIIADTQNKGKGQHGKNWISYKGNLFVSIFFTLDKINLSLKEMSKVNFFLIKKILSRYSKTKITIKFPNDLFIDNKKFCGILQETLKKNNTNYFVVGIGINLVKNPKIKNYPTTKLLDHTKLKINRNNIILKLKTIYENFISKSYKINLKSISGT